jgi:hypothetical protein
LTALLAWALMGTSRSMGSIRSTGSRLDRPLPRQTLREWAASMPLPFRVSQ